jgi:membrane protease YdiL (CAAX protease family)
MMPIIISILVVICSYVAYHFIGHSKKINNYFNLRFDKIERQVRLVIFNRIAGTLLFGIIPLIFQILLFSKLNQFKYLAISFQYKTFYYLIPIGIILIIINFFAAKTVDNLKVYPQIRKNNWNVSLLIVSALSWMLYLLGYEIMMRGFLLFTILPITGIWVAIAINTIVYALIHIPKGLKEMAGAVPMGIVLCMLTLQTGTIWIAFWLHCIMALSNEWFSLKYHPDITYKK